MGLLRRDYLYGAIEPETGENFILIMDKSETV
jgi:hypothetical protein